MARIIALIGLGIVSLNVAYPSVATAECNADQIAFASQLSEILSQAEFETSDKTTGNVYAKALSIAAERRNEPNNSSVVYLRNIEYYYLGVFSAHEGAIQRTLVHGVPIYELAKNAAILLKSIGFPQFERILRSNEKNPISRGFGSGFIFEGIDRGDDTKASKDEPFGSLKSVPEHNLPCHPKNRTPEKGEIPGYKNSQLGGGLTPRRLSAGDLVGGIAIKDGIRLTPKVYVTDCNDAPNECNDYK